MNGVVVINKPKEFTSFDVVAVVRKYTGIKKCGHCGTLDPNATGVLPVLVGNATKAQDIIPCHDKSYAAGFKFGISTDTLDVWGKIADKKESSVTKEQIESALNDFVGEIYQIPPMYSAVSKGGKRLYELARQGIEIEREKRKVTVYSLRLESFDEKNQSGILSVFCSKGTYIRTLIDDMAKSIGECAVMTSLVRTSACGFTLDDAIELDKLKELCGSGLLSEHIKSVESLFENYESVRVSDAQAFRFKNGNPLDISRTALSKNDCRDKVIYRVKDAEDNFISLGITDLNKGILKLYKHF